MLFRWRTPRRAAWALAQLGWVCIFEHILGLFRLERRVIDVYLY